MRDSWKLFPPTFQSELKNWAVQAMNLANGTSVWGFGATEATALIACTNKVAGYLAPLPAPMPAPMPAPVPAAKQPPAAKKPPVAKKGKTAYKLRARIASTIFGALAASGTPADRHAMAKALKLADELLQRMASPQEDAAPQPEPVKPSIVVVIADNEVHSVRGRGISKEDVRVMLRANVREGDERILWPDVLYPCDDK